MVMINMFLIGGIYFNIEHTKLLADVAKNLLCSYDHVYLIFRSFESKIVSLGNVGEETDYID